MLYVISFLPALLHLNTYFMLGWKRKGLFSSFGVSCVRLRRHRLQKGGTHKATLSPTPHLFLQSIIQSWHPISISREIAALPLPLVCQHQLCKVLIGILFLHYWERNPGPHKCSLCHSVVSPVHSVFWASHTSTWLYTCSCGLLLPRWKP